MNLISVHGMGNEKTNEKRNKERSHNNKERISVISRCCENNVKEMSWRLPFSARLTLCNLQYALPLYIRL